MSPEEFLEYIGEANLYRAAGKARLNLARDRYRAYVAAYREQSLLGVYRLSALAGPDRAAVRKAMEDRDRGAAMAQVPDLLG